MEKLSAVVARFFPSISLLLLTFILLRSCNNDSKILAKRIDTLNTELNSVKAELDTLQSNIVTEADLRIEGLKSEKRMIQSTDRKMMDVNRQSEIEKEIEKLQK